jgi:hypothetical protein
MVKPFRSDHLRFQALPLDLPAHGDPGAVMPTTCGVPEGVGWLGTACGRANDWGARLDKPARTAMNILVRL